MYHKPVAYNTEKNYPYCITKVTDFSCQTTNTHNNDYNGSELRRVLQSAEAHKCGLSIVKKLSDTCILKSHMQLPYAALSTTKIAQINQLTSRRNA